MSKILIDKSILLDRIAELGSEFHNEKDKREYEILKSILQQGEEYNENEAIKLLKRVDKEDMQNSQLAYEIRLFLDKTI